MPPVIVTTNKWIGKRILSARVALNTGLTLHLYQSGPQPGTAVVDPANYIECDWIGYAPVDLTGRWGPGQFVQDGEYWSEGGPFIWPNPPSGAQTVAGWWIDDGTWVQMACKLIVPYRVSPAGTPFDTVLRFQHWALAIV